jgi:feruloyl esterase
LGVRNTLQGALFASSTMLLSNVAAEASSCADLLNLKLPHAKLTEAQVVPSGGYKEPGNNSQHHDYSDLPSFCRVHGFSTPVPDSKIGFEIWLPLQRWSGRLHMVGNGAYESDIYWAQLGDRIRQNDVGVATDTGHDGQELTFGIGHPEKIVDWGQRAVHESVAAAKLVLRAYFDRDADHSYFSGCSTGGDEALSEAQRYPSDFDGIIAGDPGNDRTALNMAFLWQFEKNHLQNDNNHPILDVGDLKLLHNAVMAKCDRIDGVQDGVIGDPQSCRFDLNVLRCTELKHEGCLSNEKLQAIREMYAGPRDGVTGHPIYPGYPFGSEAVEVRANDPLPGWTGYWNNPRKPDEPQRVDFFRYWVFNNPSWNWWNFDWHADPNIALSKMADKVDATSPDLREFSRRGGKIIMFMGWADPVGSALEAIDYYHQVEDFTANHSKTPSAEAETQKFLRLYMIPGMGHCAGGPGATNFSTATRDSTPPVRDAKHDMLIALENWVEKERPPETLIGTHYSDDRKTVLFQRPICVFPKIAVYKSGDINKAASFQCELPK